MIQYVLTIVFVPFKKTADFSTGCVILHCGSDLFHHSSIKTVDYVVGQGDLTADNLRNFAGSLAAAKNITIDQIFLPADVQGKIDIVEEKLNSSANEFSTRLLENSIKIKKVVNHMCVQLLNTICTIRFASSQFSWSQPMPPFFADFREHELMAAAAVMGGLAVFGFRKHSDVLI